MPYYGKLYSKYVSTHTSVFYGGATLDSIKKQFPAWQKYFGKFLPKDKNAKIIDLGCGNGGFVYWLSEAGYKNSSGVDFSDEQIKEAKNMGIKNVFKAEVMSYLKDKSQAFNLIFTRDVFEHFSKEEIIEFMDLLYSSLSSAGILIVQTANAENILWGRIRHGDFTHQMAFTERSIRQIFLTAGLKNTKVYSQPPVAHGLRSSLRFFFWKIFEGLLRFYLLAETGSSRGIFTQNIIAIGIKDS